MTTLKNVYMYTRIQIYMYTCIQIFLFLCTTIPSNHIGIEKDGEVGQAFSFLHITKKIHAHKF
ncbi:hypothetical protein DW881_14515 [Exiguobacterium sp. AM39-5BH]|nr:hypothetical protein DW881_14515 [Exiguobacterium sp. AM39-5BH]